MAVFCPNLAAVNFRNSRFILTFSTVGSCCGLMSASNLPRCYCSPSDAAVTVESAFFSAVTRSQLRFLIQYSKVGRASKEPVETGHLQISGRALGRFNLS